MDDVGLCCLARIGLQNGISPPVPDDGEGEVTRHLPPVFQIDPGSQGRHGVARFKLDLLGADVADEQSASVGHDLVAAVERQCAGIAVFPGDPLALPPEGRRFFITKPSSWHSRQLSAGQAATGARTTG